MRDAPPPLRFDQFELDEGNARLTHQGRPIQLPPKAFAVLCALAQQPGKLVTKAALLDAVWGHQHVSESVLKTTISQVRAALSDDAAKPVYIETASRRGYRFIGSIVTATPAPGPVATIIEAPGRAETPSTMIGRRTALAKLQASWKIATAGRRQLFWIAGEAGVGKTTLIDHFIDSLGPVLLAHGQCVEQFGSGEPYLPVLEALGSLCRRDETLPQMMRAIAPTWLLQLPWLSSETDRLTLHRELVGANQDRMVRELAELMERYTQKQPLLFVTEDLHWSDHATLRLMDHFARRRNPINVMWVGSFRLTQVIAEDHPLQELRQELRLHRLCEEVVLDPFSEREVAEYIDSRVPGKSFPEAFVHRLHAHTDGLPLFVVNVLDAIADDAVVEPADSGTLPLAKAPWRVPENLAGAIERQISRLPPQVQTLLETASVCGMEFRASTLADVLEQEALTIGEHCDELVRRQYWLRHVEITALADGTLDTRYAFRHALYRHVFYQRIGVSARVQLHRRVALSMERSRTRGIAVTATELATQYEAGLVHAAALRQYVEAARSALAHFAPREAVDLCAHALTLLPRIPEGQERMEIELALVATRGMGCSQQFGLASPDAQTAYERALVLCDLLPPTSERAQVLSGLGWVWYMKGEYAEARRIADRVLGLAASGNDSTLFIMGCGFKGVILTMMAEFATARRILEDGIAACEAAGDRLPYSAFVADPLVVMRTNISVCYLHLGLFDQSRRQMDMALERARQRGQPMALVIALWCAAMLEMRMKNPQRVAEHARALTAIVTEKQIFQAEGPSRWVRGWAEAYLGSPREGHRLVLEGFAFNERLGMISGGSEVLGYAVEALILAQDWEGAQAQLNAASALARRLGERILFPYHFLLQFRIESGRGNIEAARKALRDGLVEVRAQQSQWMELRLLSELCALSDPTAEDLAALAAISERITEGRDVHVLVQARKLLAR